MDPNTLIQILAQVKDLRPVAEIAIEEFKEFYLPHLEAAGEYLIDEGCTSRIKHFLRFKEELKVEDHTAYMLTKDLHNMFKKQSD